MKRLIPRTVKSDLLACEVLEPPPSSCLRPWPSDGANACCGLLPILVAATAINGTTVMSTPRMAAARR